MKLDFHVSSSTPPSGFDSRLALLLKLGEIPAPFGFGNREWEVTRGIGVGQVLWVKPWVVCVLPASRLQTLPGTPWGLVLCGLAAGNDGFRRSSLPKKWQARGWIAGFEVPL